MKMKYIILLIAIVIIITTLFFLQPKQNEDEINPTVATTIFPLYDITKNIAGDKIEVINILPSGASPHTFEVKPSDIKKLQNVQTIFAIGHGLDNWTTNIIEKNHRVQLIIVDKNIELKIHDPDSSSEENTAGFEGQKYDPHYWLSFSNGNIIAENITEQLIKNDPENKGYYLANLKAYQLQLKEAKTTAARLLSGQNIQGLIVFHNSWGYLTQEFGLATLGIFEQAPGKEPTPKHLADLYRVVQKYKINGIFIEPQLSSETITQFAKDNDMLLYTLDPLGGGEHDSYINTLLYNARTINEAFAAE